MSFSKWHTCYIDGMFGACVSVKEIEEAIPILKEIAKDNSEKCNSLGIPAIIGTDDLPIDDQVVVRVNFEDDALIKLSQMAMERNISVNALMSEIILESTEKEKE